MKKILCSLACVGAMSSSLFADISSNAIITGEYNISTFKKDDNYKYGNDRVDNFKLSLQNFKMSEYDTDIAWYLDLGYKHFKGRMTKKDTKAKQDYEAKNLYFDVLLGPSINLSNDITRSSLNFLIGLNNQHYERKITPVRPAGTAGNVKVSTNAVKAGVNILSDFNSGFMVGFEVFLKYYVDNNRQVLFTNSSDGRIKLDTNLMLGYKFLQDDNGEGIFTGIKVGYNNDLVSKGAQFGITAGYMF